MLIIGCSTPNKDYITWEVYSGDSQGTRYSGLDQINKHNVQQLKPVWTYSTGDMSDVPASTIQCNPIVVGNKMFITSPGLKLMALEASTGKELWVFDSDHQREGHGVSRGVTYWSDSVEERLFYTARSYLYCIDPENGELIQSFGDSGKIDLHLGLGRDVSSLWVTVKTPGIVYKDLLILGSTLGEGPTPAAPGHIRAFNVKSGQIVWTFHTIPYPGEFGYETWPPDAWKRTGGANSWGGFTLDEERGMVFFGTGSPTYDHWGGDRKGKNLFGNSIVALNASTGERIWHYQVVHHDVWDYDIPCQPNLVTIQKNGRRIDAVVQPTKMGHLFVLDRETGAPLYPVEERPVPQSVIPGEETWPTQPFPLESMRYAKQSFTTADITDISPESRQHVLEQIKDMRLGSIFNPPGLDSSAVLPQFNGGTDWGGAAFDPETNNLIVNCSNELEWISMVKSKPNTRLSQFQFGRDLYGALCSWCHFQGSGTPSLSSLKHREPSYSQTDVIQPLIPAEARCPVLAPYQASRSRLLSRFYGMKGMIPKSTHQVLISAFPTIHPMFPLAITSSKTMRVFLLMHLHGEH